MITEEVCPTIKLDNLDIVYTLCGHTDTLTLRLHIFLLNTSKTARYEDIWIETYSKYSDSGEEREPKVIKEHRET